MNIAAGVLPRTGTTAWVAGRWLVLLACLLLWQLAATQAGNPYFPPPLRIAETASQLWPSRLLLTDVAPSLFRLLGSWVATAALGMLIGLLLGRSKVVADYFEFALTFLRTLPPPLLVPVFMLIFGLGTDMEVATIVFGSLWPVVINTMAGARSVDPVMVATAQVFRISRTRWLFGVVLPAAGPKVFAGLRISLSIAVVLMVISELAGSTSGIGYQLSNAQSTADLPAMWAWIVLIGLLGYLLNVALLAAEQRILAWHGRQG